MAKLGAVCRLVRVVQVVDSWIFITETMETKRVVGLCCIMTIKDRQHSLTTHFVSMVSIMNIHESTTCATRTNRHTAIWGQFSQSGEKIKSLPNYIHGSTSQPYNSFRFHGFRNEYSWIDNSYDSWIHYTTCVKPWYWTTLNIANLG